MALDPILTGQSFTSIGMFMCTGVDGTAYNALSLHPALNSSEDVQPRATIQSSTTNFWTATVTNNAGATLVAGNGANGAVVRTLNVWTLVALVYNATTHKVTIYTYDETTGAQKGTSTGTLTIDASISWALAGGNNSSTFPWQGKIAWAHLFRGALTELECLRCAGYGLGPIPQVVDQPADCVWSLPINEGSPLLDSISGEVGTLRVGGDSGGAVSSSNTSPVAYPPNDGPLYTKPEGRSAIWLQNPSVGAWTDFEFVRNPISDDLMMTVHDTTASSPRAVLCFIDEETDHFEDSVAGAAQYVVDTNITGMDEAFKGPVIGLRATAPGWAVYYLKTISGVKRIHRATPTVNGSGRPTAWTIDIIGSNVNRTNVLPSQDPTQTWVTLSYGIGANIKAMNENDAVEHQLCINDGVNAGFRNFGVAMDTANTLPYITTTHTEPDANFGQIQVTNTITWVTTPVTDDADGVKFDSNGFISEVYSADATIEEACYVALVNDRRTLRFYKPDGGGGVEVHRDVTIASIAAALGMVAVEEFFGQSPEPGAPGDRCVLTIKDTSGSGVGSGGWNQSAIAIVPMDNSTGPIERGDRGIAGVRNHEGEWYLNAVTNEVVVASNSQRGASWKYWVMQTGIIVD